MTAQEFYDKNRGKYFMYGDQKVRVVGYDTQHVIISTKKGGWELGPTHNIDRLLLNDGEKCLYINIENLNPLDPQEINLCNILEGCEGITLYSTIHGDTVFEHINNLSNYPIIVRLSDGNPTNFCKDGRYIAKYNGECTLFPSKENRDWSTFKRPIKEGMPCMCKGSDSDIWVLRTERQASYTYCVPVDIFDFKDIESNISRSIV